MSEEPIRNPQSGSDRRRDVIAAVITCSAIGAAIVHVVKPDLKIDAVTAVLLAVAVVPWLGALFDSIELPGGTKFQYKQLVDRIEAAEEHSARAGHAADDASRTARLAFVAGGSADDEGATGSTVGEAVAQLAAEYTQVRERMASSPERTNLMEQIFADLVTATRRERDFDVEGSLGSEDPGTRLANSDDVAAREFHARRIAESWAGGCAESSPFSTRTKAVRMSLLHEGAGQDAFAQLS